MAIKIAAEEPLYAWLGNKSIGLSRAFSVGQISGEIS